MQDIKRIEETEGTESVSQILTKLSKAVSTTSNAKRYSLFPIKDAETFSFYERHTATVWTNTEMKFSDDLEDFENLPPYQKEIVSWILAFFSSGDGEILQNLAFRFILEAGTLEEKAFFITQQFMELIHSEGYSLAIQALISNPEKRNALFEAADNQPFVIRKNQFMEKYIFSDLERPYRLVAFACAEGIFFISAFLVIF
jgi:ribonucleoside-diphosphate reductase subunit M2